MLPRGSMSDLRRKSWSWQRDEHRRAFAELALCRDRSVVSLDQQLGEREAEPYALGLRREQRLEHPRASLWRHAFARVGDRDLHVRGVRLRDADAELPALAERLHRIDEDVPKRLLEMSWVGQDHGQGVYDVHGSFDTRWMLQRRDHALEQFLEANLLAIRRFGAAEVEQALNDSLGGVHLARQKLEHFLHLRSGLLEDHVQV